MRLLKQAIGLLALPALAFGLFAAATATSTTTANAQSCITTYNPETGVYGNNGNCEGTGLNYGMPTANTNPLAFYPFSNPYSYSPYSTYDPYSLFYNPYTSSLNPALFYG